MGDVLFWNENGKEPLNLIHAVQILMKFEAIWCALLPPLDGAAAAFAFTPGVSGRNGVHLQSFSASNHFL